MIIDAYSDLGSPQTKIYLKLAKGLNLLFLTLLKPMVHFVTQTQPRGQASGPCGERWDLAVTLGRSSPTFTNLWEGKRERETEASPVAPAQQDCAEGAGGPVPGEGTDRHVS